MASNDAEDVYLNRVNTSLDNLSQERQSLIKMLGLEHLEKKPSINKMREMLAEKRKIKKPRDSPWFFIYPPLDNYRFIAYI